MDFFNKAWSWFSGLKRGQKALVVFGLLLVAAKINFELKPEWEQQGYQNAEIYEESVKGGFAERYVYEAAKAKGISTQAEWDKHQEALQLEYERKAEEERLARAEEERLAKAEEERLARAEEERLAKAEEERSRKGRQALASPEWQRIDALPSELRGVFTGQAGVCGLSELLPGVDQIPLLDIYTKENYYFVTYAKPRPSSIYATQPAWTNPQRNQVIRSADSLITFKYVWDDDIVFYLVGQRTIAHKKGSRGYDITLYKNSPASGWRELDGFVKDGKQFTDSEISDLRFEDMRDKTTRGMSSTTISLSEIDNIGIRNINEHKKPFQNSKTCQPSDYNRIIDATLWFQSQTGRSGTTTLRNIFSEL